MYTSMNGNYFRIGIFVIMYLSSQHRQLPITDYIFCLYFLRWDGEWRLASTKVLLKFAGWS